MMAVRKLQAMLKLLACLSAASALKPLDRRTLFSGAAAALAPARLLAPAPASAVSGGGKDYAEATIKGQDFSGKTFNNKDFSGCDAVDTNFAKSKLRGARFFKAAHPEVSGKKLALRMTSVTGIGDLLPGVKVDDWAFEPCGYSMNGLRERYYYTIHVTPESGFSYASFETNDPQYREPKWVERIASAFQPTALTLTLTTRRVGCELGAFVLGGYERSGLDTAELGKELSVCSMNFARNVEADVDELTVGGAIKERRASKTGAPWWGS